MIEQIKAYERAGVEEIMVQRLDLDDDEGLQIIAEEVLTQVAEHGPRRRSGMNAARAMGRYDAKPCSPIQDTNRCAQRSRFSSPAPFQGRAHLVGHPAVLRVAAGAQAAQERAVVDESLAHRDGAHHVRLRV